MGQKPRGGDRPDTVDVAAGGWWRFSRYELRDGHVRPAAKAVLERYDPWFDYRRSRASGGDGAAPPYQALLDLLADLRVRPVGASGRRQALSSTGEVQLLAWCARYGLLGVLLHQTAMVTFPPRWEPADPTPSRWTGKEPLWAVQWRYVRTNAGWDARRDVRLVKGVHDLKRAAKQRSRIIPHKDRPMWCRPARVIIQRLETGEWRQEPLTATWARFFPGIPVTNWETSAYPPPGTNEFWRLYEEPIEDFLRAALLLRTALEGLAHSEPWDKASEADRVWIMDGRHQLHVLTAPITPAMFLRQDGIWEQRWIAPSLLASFAGMALQDLTEQRRLLRCANVTCRRLFATAAWQAQYCSERCRYTVQKRGYRQRKHQKKKLADSQVPEASR